MARQQRWPFSTFVIGWNSHIGRWQCPAARQAIPAGIANEGGLSSARHGGRADADDLAGRILVVVGCRISASTPLETPGWARARSADPAHTAGCFLRSG